MNHIVVHYAEIGLKGGNRPFFEKKLMDNIRISLKGTGCGRVYRLYGRIGIELNKRSEAGKIRERLQKIPGISHFSFATSVERKIEKIRLALDTVAKEKKITTFAVAASRSDKAFSHTSKQLNEILGDYLRKKYRWKVDLSEPDATFFVEVTEKNAFIYTEKIKGLGGLPVTSSGKLVSLISGGIDSPVAALEMMKRGCSIVFVHFHNWTKQQKIVKDKVERLVKALSEYQPESRLYMVPFEGLQKKIILKVPSEYRMIIYRRVMFEMANEIAKMEGALGFVTGDSVGQVASQTLENLNVIYQKAAFPVFAPLIGTDKNEIINRANVIGTYELSILPYSDCCSFLVAKHPVTRSRPEDVDEIDVRMDISKEIKSALKKAKVKEF
jgi:thiamine biosynthesis protein ThiI